MVLLVPLLISAGVVSSERGGDVSVRGEWLDYPQFGPGLTLTRLTHGLVSAD